MSLRIVTCTDCKMETGKTEKQTNQNPISCVYCGSMKKTVQIAAKDYVRLDLKVRGRGKVKDDRYKSKEKVRRDFLHGDDLHRKSGKWYKKDRVIDKETDQYKEVVTDPETGQIIHECEEPLSEHRGNGSAKIKVTNKHARYV